MWAQFLPGAPFSGWPQDGPDREGPTAGLPLRQGMAFPGSVDKARDPWNVPRAHSGILHTPSHT